jgi:hypothetical protein
MASAVLLILIIGGGVALSLVGLLLVRRFASFHFLEEHTPTAGSFIQVVGTLYAVLIAFSVVITWNHCQDARGVATREANCANDAFRLCEGLDLPEGPAMRQALLEYGRAVMGDEWEKMSDGQESQMAIDAYTRLWDLISVMSPQTERDKVLFSKLLDSVLDMSDARRERLVFSRGRLEAAIWFIIWAGSALTIGFGWFFSVPQIRKQVLMTAMLSGMIFLSIFTIVTLNRPFTGDARIKPDAMRFAVAHMEGSLARQRMTR